MSTKTRHALETRIVRGVRVDALPAVRVRAELQALLDAGLELRPAGLARRNPKSLLRRYPPAHRLRLFDASFYLAELRQEPNARFFITYVRLPGARALYPRFFYKDGSLIWRSASHFARSADENWVGKGDLKTVVEHGKTCRYSAEETTNLPLEIQGALDALSRRNPHIPRDDRAIGRVLRRSPDSRVRAYRDFTEPRRRAQADPRNRIHGGKPVAWFARPGDPDSLRFARGFEPDFARGVLETARATSRLYGGLIRKFRVLSANRSIQYQFAAGPHHAWIVPPQALTTELSSFGVRTVDVWADDDVCVPGLEYHFMDDSLDPPALYSQIPAGFAGRQSVVDPARADASPWLERLAVIQEFRKALGLRRREDRR